MNSLAEENYLKAIFKLSKDRNDASTNAVAEELNTKASSVTDMLKKLAEKKLVKYVPYKGVQLTEKGRIIALSVVRKHRLWEVFLVEKLNFKWDEVHDIAEQLEHINSSELVERLDNFLENPKYDPHGDPIPDKNGNVLHHKNITLADLRKGESCLIVGVKEHTKAFLNYLEQTGLVLGASISINNIIEFDQSMSINIDNSNTITISHQASKNLIVKKL